MKRFIRPIGFATAALAAAALVSGCVAVPADPYYGGYSAYGYGSTAAYPVEPAVVGAVPYYYGGPGVVVAPPLSIGIVGSFGSSYHRRGWGPRPGWSGGHRGWGGRRGGGFGGRGGHGGGRH